MKKTLLLLAATLFAGSFTVSAQDPVQPVEPTPFVQRDELKPQAIPGDLTLGDCKITVMQGETPAKTVYAAPGEDSKWEGATLGNTNNGYIIEYNCLLYTSDAAEGFLLHHHIHDRLEEQWQLSRPRDSQRHRVCLERHNERSQQRSVVRTQLG